jgi:hypothetical protein
VEAQNTEIQKHDNIALWKGPVSASGGLMAVVRGTRSAVGEWQPKISARSEILTAGSAFRRVRCRTGSNPSGAFRFSFPDP